MDTLRVLEAGAAAPRRTVRRRGRLAWVFAMAIDAEPAPVAFRVLAAPAAPANVRRVRSLPPIPLPRVRVDPAARSSASYLRAVNPRVRRKYTAHPLRGWIARLQNSPNHTPGFQGALAQDVRAMRASIADAIDQERLPLPRDELEVGFGAER